MGYRFSLKNANSVGSLVEKNTLSFLQTTTSSEDYLTPNLDFIQDFIFNPERTLFSSYTYRRFIDPRFKELQTIWPQIRMDIETIYHKKDYDNLDIVYSEHKQVLDFLVRVSNILANCRQKSLLLPGFDFSDLDYSMINPTFLKDLVKIHPGNSVLILQLTQMFESNAQIPLLNVFSKFNTAVDMLEQWPGILLWNGNESLFVPVKDKSDVLKIFTILKFESGAFQYIRDEILQKRKQKKFYYLFHLSDLHFGNKTVDSRKLRVEEMLSHHRSKLEDCIKAYPIITGDLVDSPSIPNQNLYSQFSRVLTLSGFEQPVKILGNHDVDSGGFLKKFTKEKAVIQSLTQEKYVEVIEELKIAIVKFDSNKGGNLAQGEIGQNQFGEIGSELDKLNRPELTYIAILHHHPIKIENPEWYQVEWYEKILGKIGYEYTMQLIDSKVFLDFIEKRKINFVLHGHKHIPRIHEHEKIQILSAGSTTGNIKHTENGKTYLSYNVIKIDGDNLKPVSCTVFAEDTFGAGPSNVIMKRIK